MITYREALNQNKFCKCQEIASIHVEQDEWGYWSVCNTCGLPIEDTYEYNNECADDC